MKTKDIKLKNYLIKSLTIGFLKLITLGLLGLNLTACSEDDTFVTATQPYGAPSWDSREACDYQQVKVGIPGNVYCPYQGQSYNGQVEAYAMYEYNGAIYLDFGLRYNDQCPPGEVPVFEYYYGKPRLKSCDPVGDDYVDNVFYQHHNISSCSGGYGGNKNCIPL